MDNHYLSAGESIYYGSSMPAMDVLPANRPSAPIATSPPPVKLRKAGRKKLDATGKMISGQRTALRLQRMLDASEKRQAARAEETKRKKDTAAAHQERKAEAAQAREKDIARANKVAIALVPADPLPQLNYQLLFTDQNGIRHVKVAPGTTLQISAGKDIDEAVSRYNNRKRIIF